MLVAGRLEVRDNVMKFLIRDGSMYCYLDVL